MSDRLPTLLMTRPRAQSETFARSLATRLDAMPPVVIAPVMDIVPRPLAEIPDACRGVLMTSAQAARAVALPDQLRGLPAHVVGARTAAAARAVGLRPVTVAPTSRALLARLLAERVPGPLLYLRGEVIRTDLAQSLNRAGTETIERVVYAQSARPLPAEARMLLEGSSPVVAPLFSPRSAALFAGWLSEVALAAPLRLLALSPAVARAWPGPAAADIGIAPEPTAEAMVEFVASACRGGAG